MCGGKTLAWRVGKGAKDREILGTLTSSNSIEKVTIEVGVGLRPPMRTVVEFGGPTYDNDVHTRMGAE